MESSTTFWIASALIAGLVAAILGLALMRRRKAGASAAASDVQVYRDQLNEIDRDLERGVIEQAEAERARTEVSRRLLEAVHARQSAPAGGRLARPNAALALLVAVTVLGGAFLVYRQVGTPGYPDLPEARRLALADAAYRNRISQAEAEAGMPPHAPPADVSARRLELMDKLRTAVARRPDDLEGHVLLAQNEAALGNFVAAYKAQQDVVRLLGDKATANDLADLANLMVLAAGGYVSPEAEAVLRKVRKLDPHNGVARFYIGLMDAQNGRPDLAFRLWEKLLEESRPEAPWVPPIRQQIEAVAREAGIRYRLPPESAGPSAADIAAARDMSAQDRQAMIRSMVERLSNRLQTQGGSAEEWARLIGALGVLGEQARARAVRDKARATFSGNEAALSLIAEAAQRAGLKP